MGRNVDENVNFIYSSSFPTNIEIYGDRVVEPVGLQEGLGMMGFCYVDYPPNRALIPLDFPFLLVQKKLSEIFSFEVYLP